MTIRNISAFFNKCKEEAAEIAARDFRRIREYFGLTQAQLAEAMDRLLSDISDIETGKLEFTICESYVAARAAQMYGQALGIQPKGQDKIDSPASYYELNSKLRQLDKA